MFTQILIAVLSICGFTVLIRNPVNLVCFVITHLQKAVETPCLWRRFKESLRTIVLEDADTQAGVAFPSSSYRSVI